VFKFREAQTLIKAALLFTETVNDDGSEFTDKLSTLSCRTMLCT